MEEEEEEEVDKHEKDKDQDVNRKGKARGKVKVNKVKLNNDNLAFREINIQCQSSQDKNNNYTTKVICRQTNGKKSYTKDKVLIMKDNMFTLN